MTSIILFSLVVIDLALQFLFLSLLTISKFNSVKASSTITIVCSFVTLNPSMNLLAKLF